MRSAPTADGADDEVAYLSQLPKKHVRIRKGMQDNRGTTVQRLQALLAQTESVTYGRQR